MKLIIMPADTSPAQMLEALRAGDLEGVIFVNSIDEARMVLDIEGGTQHITNASYGCMEMSCDVSIELSEKNRQALLSLYDYPGEQFRVSAQNQFADLSKLLAKIKQRSKPNQPFKGYQNSRRRYK